MDRERARDRLTKMERDRQTEMERDEERDGEHTSNCVTAPYFSSPVGEKYLLL